ncbi:hypothetical protein OsJ_33245 [Oryza sativa Japonica Group]|nr:hypothetical protein OsJ_33245 [Oryza sativa Japonica Group]
MPNLVVKDCQGKSGGLAVFWKKEINLRLRTVSRLFMDVDVMEDDGFWWRFTGVYGEPRSDKKDLTWKALRTLNATKGELWLCVGDFNEVLFSWEKERGHAKAQSCMDRFRQTLDCCSLSNLGFTGDPFTWRNNWCVRDGYIRERLDRAVADSDWCCRFPSFRVRKGDPRHSDHHPVIVTTSNEVIWNGGRSKPGFRFEAGWAREEHCAPIVENAWKLSVGPRGGKVMDAIREVAANLWDWSKNFLGDLEKRIKKAKQALEAHRRSPISSSTASREAVLKYRLDKLEEQRELYWRQRANQHWLEKGDRNTKFFHECASERKKRNKIKKLRRDDGEVITDEAGSLSLISEFYKQLFTAGVPLNLDELLQNVPKRVTSTMNDELMKGVTTEEIKKALDSIGDLKAPPGSDGMPALFYKQFWECVGDDIVHEVKDFLGGGEMPDSWNDTVVVLIPKVPNPERIKDLRPISLCNVVYKIASKVLANRLKPLLSEIISPIQIAFVPQRMITDNILLAYELTHFLKTKRRGSVGFAAVKQGMSKAYDRVEWGFLEKMMLKLGFDRNWVFIVMKCVTSVTYRIKVNGEFTEQINPTGGLRQGDPISPYLFFICAEGFSTLLNAAEERGDLSVIKVCQNAPSINHLLFADDSLLLLKTDEGSAACLQNVLSLYERCSGETINKEKSSIMFSRNIKEVNKQIFMGALDIGVGAWNEKYLGLPVYMGRSKAKTSSYLKERVWKKIQGWKEKLLSRAGKDVLIKAVAQAIPAFAMSCFNLTKGLCDEITSLICRFFWAQQERENKMHWIAWEHLCSRKEKGGFFFRRTTAGDLPEFN